MAGINQRNCFALIFVFNRTCQPTGPSSHFEAFGLPTGSFAFISCRRHQITLKNPSGDAGAEIPKMGSGLGTLFCHFAGCIRLHKKTDSHELRPTERESNEGIKKWMSCERLPRSRTRIFILNAVILIAWNFSEKMNQEMEKNGSALCRWDYLQWLRLQVVNSRFHR